MKENYEKPVIDLTNETSGTTKSIQFKDNNSHAFCGADIAVTDGAHVQESGSSLAWKVNKVVPDLLLPSIENIGNGFNATIEVRTSSGTHNFTYGVKKEGNIITLTGAIGNSYTSIPIDKGLLKPNKYGKTADSSRSVYVLLFRCLNMQFIPSNVEERAFRKLFKKLWPSEKK